MKKKYLCAFILVTLMLFNVFSVQSVSADNEEPQFAVDAGLGEGWDDLGKTFYADGAGWKIIDIDEQGNYFITSISSVHNMKFNPTSLVSMNQPNAKSYVGSSLEGYLNNIYLPSLVELQPYIKTADISDTTYKGKSFVADSGTVLRKVFPLSFGETRELFKTSADRQLENARYWGRTPSINDNITVSYVTAEGYIGSHIVVDYDLNVRPAMWVSIAGLPAPEGPRPIEPIDEVKHITIDELRGQTSEIGKTIKADGMIWKVMKIDAAGNAFIVAEDLVTDSTGTYLPVQYNTTASGDAYVYENSLLDRFMTNTYLPSLTDLNDYILDSDISDVTYSGVSEVVTEANDATALARKVYPLSRAEAETFYTTNESRSLYFNYWLRTPVTVQPIGRLVCYVYSAGNINPNGSVTSSMYVRPAMWVKSTPLVNTTGQLKISKVVSGDPAPKNDIFEFTVTFSGDRTREYDYSIDGGAALTIKSGETIRLKANQAASFTGIEAETKYEIVETARANYTVTPKTGKYEGVIAANAESAASFTNTYKTPVKPNPTDPSPGEKPATGETPATGDPANMTVLAVLMGVSLLTLGALVNKKRKVKIVPRRS